MAVVDESLDLCANFCSILALLKYNLNLFWAGIYWVEKDELKLGPFQGMVACTKIKMGKGACGIAARDAKTVVLKDVIEFPGYIACHSETKSEIVIPGIFENKVLFVLDIDSIELDYFDESDEKYLNEIVSMLVGIYKSKK